MSTARPRMRLRRFVSRRGVTQLTRDFRAAGFPVTRQAVYGWLNGRRTPRPHLALQLVRMSGGAIRVTDVLALPAATRAEPEAPCRSR